MLKIILIVLLCSTFALGKGTVQLMNSKQYMKAVAQQFIYELEDYGVCNTKFPDFFQNISIPNYFGMEIIGTINYTNGFLSTFQEVGIQKDVEVFISAAENSAHMKLGLVVTSLIIFFDYHANLTEGKFSGTVAIPKRNFEMNLLVDKFYDTGDLNYNIEITGSASDSFTIIWDYIPSNSYTEVINKDVTFGLMDDKNKKELEKLWTTILGKAIKKIPFPKICYNC